MKKLINSIFFKSVVRRYNFIVEDRLLYSGLFNKVGVFSDLSLIMKLNNKKRDLSNKYGYSIKEISVSNTIKG